MVAVRLDEEIEKRLNTLVKVTRRSKSYYIREALRQFLDEQEDVLIALSRLESQNGTLLSTDELWQKLGWTEE